MNYPRQSIKKIANRRELPFKGKAATLQSFILLKDRILVFTHQQRNYQYLKLKNIRQQTQYSNETAILDSSFW